MPHTLFPVSEGISAFLSASPDRLLSEQNPYRQVFETAHEAFFLMDETGHLMDCNRAYLDLLGYGEKSDLLPTDFAALAPPTQANGAVSRTEADALITLARRNGHHEFEWLLRRSDNTNAALHVTLSALPNDGETKRILLGMVQDGTEQKRLEDALQEAARSVSATTGETFFRSLVLYLARALEADYAFIGELTGENEDSIRTTAVCVDGQIVPNIEYALRGTPCANVTSLTFAAAAGCEVCAYPTGAQTAFPDDGLLVEMGVDGYVGTALYDSSGRVLGLLVVLYRKPVRALGVVKSMLQVFAARAATELERRKNEQAREQTLAALTESEERFKSAFERSAIGMAIIGLDDYFLQANQALCRLLGYSAEEMRGLTTASISHPDDLIALRKNRDNSSRLLSGTIDSFQVEKRYQHKQGHYFWALVGVSLVRDAQGNLIHYITQVQDISEQKRAEAERTDAIEALKRANEQLEARVQERTAELERDRALLEAVLRQMPAGVMVAEAPSGRLLLGNEQISRILGDANNPLSGIEDLARLALARSNGDLYAPGETPLSRTLRTGEIVTDEEASILRGDGTRGVLLISSAPIHNEQGQIVAAVGMGQDITSRKNTEEALRRLHNELEMQVQERTAELEQANKSLQTEVQERRRAEQVSRGQTQALTHTLNALTAQSDLDTFLSYLMAAIRDVLHADSLGIELYDGERNRTVPRHSYAGDQLLTTEMLQELGIAPFMPADDDVTWQAVLADPRPFGVYDVQNDERLIYRKVFWEFGVRSALVVPMLRGESPIGYLFICHQTPRHYGPEERELARTLAQQVVLALQLETLATKGEEAAVLGERNRLAREIHDTLAQGFAGILIHLQLAQTAMERKPDRALPALLQARDLAKASLAEARRSVLALRPTALDNASLPEAFRRMTDGVTSGTGLRCRMEVRGAPCPLPRDIEEHLLRIGQEALNNTVKYAEANEASIVLSFDDGFLSLQIRDNGVGFTPGNRPRGGGFGHVSMRERLEALRGQLTINSSPNEGTEIFARVPIACSTETGKN